MSPRRRLSAVLWLAFSGLALALPAAARPEIAAVHLLAPQAGATLLAGSTAELEWEAELPARITEWEAFLSFDGGETYPVRITPHLDRDLRQVRWRVPGIPTSDARLLLRFGDERREIYRELPHRFSIASAARAEWAFPLANVAAAPGEPALPGQRGVIAWVEGSRRGGSLRQKVAPEPMGLRSTYSLPVHPTEVAVLKTEESNDPPPAPVRRNAGGADPLARRAARAELAPPLLFSSDILLLTQRQNE